MKKYLLLAVVAIAMCAALAARAAAEPETGKIKVATPGVTMVLRSGRSTVTLSPSANELDVRAGRYVPSSLQISATEIIEPGPGKKEEVSWALQAAGAWGKLSSITVRAGETVVLEPGPPFILRAKPSYAGQGVIGISYQLVGNAGEGYSPAAVRNQKVVSPPKLKIVDESGKLLASGSFQYG